MKEYSNAALINDVPIVNIISNALTFIDKRLVRHGERVAYIAREIIEAGSFEKNIEWPKLFPMCVFHDVGAYKTEEIDNMLEFESGGVWQHSLYGYVFLKNMTPLKELSQCIWYHHMPFDKMKNIKADYKDYSELIHLSDRIDVLFNTYGGKCIFDESNILNRNFDPKFADAFMKANVGNRVIEALAEGEYIQKVKEWEGELEIKPQVAMQYLEMLVYSIDFRSEHTVTHTINTTAISLEIAEHFNASQEECEKIYLGALLHDIGKIAIPLEILEFPGKLDDEEMVVMKTHVEYTERIIKDLVEKDVCNIACRHHETLDGKGYHKALKESELSIWEQAVAVADILSALSGKRSYKEVFPKDKTLGIIKALRDSNKLNAKICDFVLDKYDEIMAATERSRAPVIKLYKKISEDFKQLTEQTKEMYGCS